MSTIENNDFLSALGSVLSALVALVALLYSYSQSNIKKYEIKRDYRNTILSWFSETIKVLIELRLLLNESPEEFKQKKIVLLSHLSAQIELGRLYFPNIDKGDKFGHRKPKAFQGYRNLVLDFLVFSFNILSSENAKNYNKHLVRLQREFTSIVCEITEPEDFLNETKKHSNKFFTQRVSYEDFLGRNPDNIDFFFPDQIK